MYLKSQNATGYAVLCEEWQTYDDLFLTWFRLRELAVKIQVLIGDDPIGLAELEMIINAIRTSKDQDEMINKSLTFHPSTNNAEKQ